MKIFNTITVILLWLILFPFSGETVLAAPSDFQTSVTNIYSVNTEGTVNVNQKYSLTNQTAAVYPTSYKITINAGSVSNILASMPNGTKIPYTLESSPHSTVINLNFPEKNVGKGKTMEFSLSYESPDFSNKKGSSLELTIPGTEVSSPLTVNSSTLMVPLEFGLPVSLSPKPDAIQNDPSFSKIIYNTEGNTTKSINAVFGDKQIYDILLSYHLSNSTITPVNTQIALPPDTQNQKVFLETIDPPPQSIELDRDGNWIATYNLKPKEDTIVNYHSQIIVYSSNLPEYVSPQFSVDELTKEKEYWPTSHPTIKSKASKLNSAQSIYGFVTETLKYNYDRIDSKDYKRIGALAALANPGASLCLEFSDLFVTLSRSAGIPAKLMTGYGYSDNSLKRPTGEGSNIYHAWASYYDSTTNTWHEVDPTWGNTTGGNDYFSQIGFNHVVFTIHGSDSSRPYGPGSYQSTDSTPLKIEVSDKFPNRNLKISTKIIPSLLFYLGLSPKLNLSLTNESSVALYNFPVDISTSNRKLISNPNPVVNTILPYQTVILPLKFEYPQSLKPTIINTLIYGQSQTYTIKSYLPVGFILGLLFLLTFLAVIIIGISRKSRRLLVS